MSGSNDLSDYQTTDTKPYLPDTTKFEKVAGTDLSTGLVMKEKATGSEYVWVEVPKTTVFTTALNITEFTDDDYTKIENDLHTYTNDYRNGTGYSDVYYADSRAGWFADSNAYDTAKKRMLKSVYDNGGFWVGRYEAGIETNRTSSGTATTAPLTKANLYPYTYVTRTQAKVLAEQVESGSYTSSLMFGVQWDLVLKYIETKKVATVTDIKRKLNSDSTPIGNYFDNTWNITNANAKYSTNSGISFSACPYSKTSNASLLLTTGADASFSLMNIYDIAGNVWEWTLEYTSSTDNPCANRGGSCNNGGSGIPASYRDYPLASDSIDFIGFRVSLY